MIEYSRKIKLQLCTFAIKGLGWDTQTYTVSSYVVNGINRLVLRRVHPHSTVVILFLPEPEPLILKGTNATYSNSLSIEAQVFKSQLTHLAHCWPCRSLSYSYEWVTRYLLCVDKSQPSKQLCYCLRQASCTAFTQNPLANTRPKHSIHLFQRPLHVGNSTEPSLPLS